MARASQSLHLWCHTALSHAAKWQQPLAVPMHAAHLKEQNFFQDNITMSRVGHWGRARGQGGGDVPQDAIQALDVALKHGTALKANCQAFARAFFWDDPTKVRPLGGGAEVRLPLELPALAAAFCTQFCSVGLNRRVAVLSSTSGLKKQSSTSMPSV